MRTAARSAAPSAAAASLEPVFVEDVDELPAAIGSLITDGDVVLTMGAGSIGAVAHDLPAALGRRRCSHERRRRARRIRGSRAARTSRCRGTRPGASAGLPTSGSRRRDVEDLSAFLRALPSAVPVTWVGLGSNLLVRDGGIRGAVISVHGILSDARAHRVRPRARRGGRRLRAAWPAMRQVAARPGGILRRHSGHRRRGARDECRGVGRRDLAARGRRLKRSTARANAISARLSEYRYGYRSITPPVAGEWFLAGVFRFEARPDASTASIRKLLEKRHASQPIGAWSCGSVFTNPSGGHAAS